MKINAFLASLTLLAALTAGACSHDEPTPAPEPEPEPELPSLAGSLAKGADVSWLTKMENEGLKFYSKDGTQKECMQLLRDDCGVNSIRLRVWVNPADSYNSIDDVMVKARRAHKLGMRLMIDFHFSDTWADPGNQKMPKAWEGLSLEDLKKAVAAHVTAMMTALKLEGITPEWVQIGNETTPGMMLPMGSVDKPEQLTALNNAAYDAVKAVSPNTQCIVHLDAGNDQWRYNRMFDIFKICGGKYDMIGMSLYPYWAEEQGKAGGWKAIANQCVANISYLKEKYGKPVMICEVGMPYNKGAEAKTLIEMLMKTPVEGIFYWEPQAPAGYNSGYSMGCFDNGKPTQALDAFKN